MGVNSMSNSIVPQQDGGNPFEFIFNGCPVRVGINANGDPLFIASDICKALEIANVGNALSRLDPDEKDDIRLADTIGRMQNMAAVNESGLYSLILRSDKPDAKRFKRWITHEVLPSIRKSGAYFIQPLNQFDVMRHAINALEDHEKRIHALEDGMQRAAEHFTVLGYYRKMGLTPPSNNEAQSVGLRARKLSEAKGYSVGKTSDPRYGNVNTYHQDILKEIVK